MEFVWSPVKGEPVAAYMQRALKENPSLSLTKLIEAKGKAHINNVRLDHLVHPPGKVIPVVKLDIFPKVEVNASRELELERENAKLRLQVLRLEERLKNAQSLIRNYHREKMNGEV